MRYIIIILFSFTCNVCSAQQLLKGQVMDSKTDQPLDGATLFNTTQALFRKAGQNGMFSIPAKEKDVIIFSSAGYSADTIEISQELLNSGLFIGLKAQPINLDTVTVTRRTYSEDSIQRRLEYQHLLERPLKNVSGGNTPQYGTGIVISPSAIFSKSEKQKRAFRKDFSEYEKNAFIDYHFSPSYVHRMTGLEGEELQKFMRMYRPTYSFMRKATPEDLLLYLNDALKKFKQ